MQSLTARGVAVEFLIFTGEDAPVAMLMLSVMGAVAEFERTLIRERQREGIALAKQRGVYRGATDLCILSRSRRYANELRRGRRRQGSPENLASADSPCIACCGSTNSGTSAGDHALFASRRSGPGSGIQNALLQMTTNLFQPPGITRGFVAERWT